MLFLHFFFRYLQHESNIMHMKRTFLFFAFWLVALVTVQAQEKKFMVYPVGFYNLENLFDTCHDAGKKDYEFLPTGSYKWNGLKYSHKLNNMAKVLSEMGTDMVPYGCVAIGVSEVENARALDDLVAQPALAARGIRYCHIEGPDKRGVDCALLYNPRFFTVKDVVLHPYVQSLEQDSAFFTRGFLTVSGELAGETLTIIVNHLPSRAATSFYREQGARQICAIKDSILKASPKTKVLVMGDMNDDPKDPSMAVELRGKAEISEVGKDDMYNPWWNVLYKECHGTLMYNNAWNLFDQILLTPNLLCKKGKKDYSSLKYLKKQVFRRDYLFQQEGKYKGSPKRTHAGGVWLDGYSDHLPTIVYLVKQL